MFFSKLDSLIDEPVFMPLYRRYADKPGFPELRPLLDKLGADLYEGELRLQPDASLAGIRAAITACKTQEPDSACKESASDADIY